MYNQLLGPLSSCGYFIWPSLYPGLIGILSDKMSDGAPRSGWHPNDSSNNINDENEPSSFRPIYNQDIAYTDAGGDNFFNALNQSSTTAAGLVSSLESPQTPFQNVESVNHFEFDHHNLYSPGPSSSSDSWYPGL